MSEKALAKRPSILIHKALDDMEEVENMPEYKINMDDYHTGTYNTEKCEVCLAGCVMANTLECEINADPFLNKWGEITGNKLRALDQFRCGNILVGFNIMKINWDDKLLEDVEIKDYDSDPEEFKSDLRALADMLYGLGH